ncbi:hypothetical protein Ahy_B06g083518 [Arachis hypogaea]|uniref:Transposase MuDR plant domain-containing protein n=1 Tax=Arachis hypogaea TaxID=3818 RepID=A0A444YPW5_ARAHY|nr:hypothetical protein Ahy_B06g083518 [Arachis hypogaea]
MHFEIMRIIDETSIQRIFHIHQQTKVQHSRIELYIEFEHIAVDGTQHDLDMHDDRVEAYEGMYSDSDEEFKDTYEASDEDEDGDAFGEAVVKNVVVPPTVSVDDLDDGEFWIRMKYSSRKLVIAVIRSCTISRGVDYIVYESEPQTFYAKCKTYGRGCD